MSGFFGMVRTDGMAVEPRFLELIAQRLHFRGPEGSQTWAKDGLGACFAYLETGTRYQSRSLPIHLGGRYTLLGEVRLDAQKELIRELLEKKQEAIEGGSDEELLLLAWSVWGEGALAKLLGDYSFALWDASQQTLFCARDFCGARPFFYSWREGVFCHSNTLNVLRLTPEVSDALDETYVREFLLTGLCSDPTRTVWRDIRRLHAGHRLILSGGQIHVQRFLSLPIEEPLRFKQSNEYLENYKELLARAVDDRLPAGKASFSLSGGLDSGSVCATASRIANKTGNFEAQRAFTISWRPLFDDPEPEFAQLTARHLGLACRVVSGLWRSRGAKLRGSGSACARCGDPSGLQDSDRAWVRGGRSGGHNPRGQNPRGISFQAGRRAADCGTPHRKDVPLLSAPNADRGSVRAAEARHVGGPRSSRTLPGRRTGAQLHPRRKTFLGAPDVAGGHRRDCGAPLGDCLGARAAGRTRRRGGADGARGPAAGRIAAGGSGARGDGRRDERGRRGAGFSAASERLAADAGYLPPPLYRRAMFRLKMGGGGLSGMAYLMRLSLSPTEEDWAEGREERGSWVWEAIKRPFRLMRKYGQDG